MLNLPNVTETVLWRRILGRVRYVACYDAASMDAVSWSMPSLSLSTRELNRLYNTGKHTNNGGRTTAYMYVAVVTRYKHTPELVKTFAQALEKLSSGYVITIAGNYHNLPSILQRWDRKFASSPDAPHAVCVGPIDTTTVDVDDPLVWWRDPLGHGSSYHGEWVRWSTVMKFSTPHASVNMIGYPHGGWI